MNKLACRLSNFLLRGDGSDSTGGSIHASFQSLEQTLEILLDVQNNPEAAEMLMPGGPSEGCIGFQSAEIKDVDPMVWEAHSVSLSPGKETIIPILLNINPADGNVSKQFNNI